MKIHHIIMSSVAMVAMAASAAAQSPQSYGELINNYNLRLYSITLPEVAGELELTERQLEGFRGLQAELREWGQERAKRFHEDPAAADHQDRFKRTAEKVAQWDEQFHNLLQPGQAERLKQVLLQLRIQRVGAARAFFDPILVEALGITQEQRADIAKAASAVEQRRQERLNKIREDAQAKLLDVLSDEQRKIVIRLFGEEKP